MADIRTFLVGRCPRVRFPKTAQKLIFLCYDPPEFARWGFDGGGRLQSDALEGAAENKSPFLCRRDTSNKRRAIKSVGREFKFFRRAGNVLFLLNDAQRPCDRSFVIEFFRSPSGTHRFKFG